jgi:DNA-binding MarR family transcriptional regulator
MNTTPTTPTEAVTAALAAHPESSAAELAEAAGIGGSTASKYLADLERDGVAVRRPGGHEGGRRVADRWALADAVAPIGPGTEPGTGAVTEGVPTTHDEGSAPRLHKGELSTLVLDFLKAHSGDAIGPSAIGKALGRSSGAVANACQRLEASGSLRLASDSLRRYQIADA